MTVMHNKVKRTKKHVTHSVLFLGVGTGLCKSTDSLTAPDSSFDWRISKKAGFSVFLGSSGFRQRSAQVKYGIAQVSETVIIARVVKYISFHAYFITFV